jgi:hypothetical protein
MVFNNPEFGGDDSPENFSTSSMQDDDLYEWSKYSQTPTNKLSSNQDLNRLRPSNGLGRLSGGLSPGGN